jgi:hypothetical protein
MPVSGMVDSVAKSKLAEPEFFGETSEHEAIDGSFNLTRGTEVAVEFNVRR